MEKYWIEVEYVGQYGGVNSRVAFDDIRNHLCSPEIESLVDMIVDHNCTNEFREVNWYRLRSNGIKEKVAHLDVLMFEDE